MAMLEAPYTYPAHDSGKSLVLNVILLAEHTAIAMYLYIAKSTAMPSIASKEVLQLAAL